MLLKLLKYEIKSSYSRFIVAFSGYILIASILMMFFRDYEIINTSSFIFGIIALSVVTFLTIFKRYNTNLYGSEGYLMFTLPVDGKILLTSKLVSAFIWMCALALIIVPSVTMLICSYSDSNYIRNSYNFFEINKTYTIIFGIEYLLDIVLSVLVIYFSISISKLPIWKRFSVLAGFGTYFFIELFNCIPLLMLKNGAKYVRTTAGFNVLVKDYSINNLLIWCFFDLFIFGLLFFATSYLLDNKASLK